MKTIKQIFKKCFLTVHLLIVLKQQSAACFLGLGILGAYFFMLVLLSVGQVQWLASWIPDGV